VRQAYELILSMMLHNVYEVICEPLVEFLIVALIKPSAANVVPLTYSHAQGMQDGFLAPRWSVTDNRSCCIATSLP
jgi:hypothetical protein